MHHYAEWYQWYIYHLVTDLVCVIQQVLLSIVEHLKDHQSYQWIHTERSRCLHQQHRFLDDRDESKEQKCIMTLWIHICQISSICQSRASHHTNTRPQLSPSKFFNYFVSELLMQQNHYDRQLWHFKQQLRKWCEQRRITEPDIT